MKPNGQSLTKEHKYNIHNKIHNQRTLTRSAVFFLLETIPICDRRWRHLTINAQENPFFVTVRGATEASS